jgi:flagellar motor switch protein FliG
MPKQKLKSLLSSIDTETLILGLQNVNNNLKDQVLSNITNKALLEFEKMEEKFKSFDDKEVKNAKRRIINKIKKIVD